jgi:hypothetical protein
MRDGSGHAAAMDAIAPHDFRTFSVRSVTCGRVRIIRGISGIGVRVHARVA